MPRFLAVFALVLLFGASWISVDEARARSSGEPALQINALSFSPPSSVRPPPIKLDPVRPVPVPK
jgi:hypothetical protein